jgi:hypothetical protein
MKCHFYDEPNGTMVSMDIYVDRRTPQEPRKYRMT